MLKLFNTLTRSKESFKPRSNGKVKIFTCGPSIYKRPHIGNYRTFLYEDILVKYLTYLGHDVERVINFTDVEDKTIEEAQAQQQDLKKITSEVADHFYEETKLLNILLPPRVHSASDYVSEAAELIQLLITKGYAYWYEKDVFFDPLKFKGFGKLFKLDLSKWPKTKHRFKKDTYPGRRWNLGDFILWHGCKNENHFTPCWDTVLGKGRPSWNIQDPAIIINTLGPAIDINCGGIDNIFRHHDYNIAILEAASNQEFAHYYLHGEHLLVNGKSMSKSAGNIIYPQDIIKRGFTAEQLRFFLLNKHYRKKLNFTSRNLERAGDQLASLIAQIQKLTTAQSAGGRSATAASVPSASSASASATSVPGAGAGASSGAHSPTATAASPSVSTSVSTSVPVPSRPASTSGTATSTSVPNPISSSTKIEQLIREIQTRFERHMNDDLDVEQAVKAVYALLKELAGYHTQGLFTEAYKENLLQVLRKIDTVWGILF